MIVRADRRYRAEHDGVTSWHCFSAGAYFDQANVSFGDLIGVDEHVVEPGAGFEWHAHRGSLIASWVVDGLLRHQDDRGADRVIAPGELFGQDARGGIRHRETCVSSTPLRFVQQTALAGSFDVWRSAGSTDAQRWHLFVAGGEWSFGDDVLYRGDSMRGTGAVHGAGTGALLVWTA